MAFVMFGRKGKVRRVPDGQFEKRKCPECERTTVFRECVVSQTYTAYHFVNLWTSELTKFCCDACSAVLELDETDEPELSPREQARKDEQDAALRAKQSRIAAKQARLSEQRAQAREEAAEEAVEDELAAMKKRLGL